MTEPFKLMIHTCPSRLHHASNSAASARALASSKPIITVGTMLGRLYPDQACAIARTLEVVGERWTLLILRDALFAGSARFSDFERRLGIATNILSKRLEHLVETGLLTLSPSESGAEDRRYAVTDKALDLVPLLMAATQWGEKWAHPGPIAYIDRQTGGELTLRILRSDTGVPVKVDAVGVRIRSGDRELKK